MCGADADELDEFADFEEPADQQAPLQCIIDRVNDLSAVDFRAKYCERLVIVQTAVSDFAVGSQENLISKYELNITAGTSFVARSRGNHHMTISAFLRKDVKKGWQKGLDYALDVTLAE